MTCDEIEDRLPAYREDLLTAGERKIMAGHLATCPRCSGALARLKKTEQLLQGLGEVEPPPFFEQRIMSRVRQEAGRKRTFLRRLFYPLHIKIPIQALASLLIAVIAIQVYQAGEPEMQRIAPIPIPMAERATEQVAGAPPGQPVSPSIPVPARRAPAGDLPEMKGERYAAPPPEKGVTSQRGDDMRAPTREEPPPAPGEAEPRIAARERETAPAVTDGREKPPDRVKKQHADRTLDGLPAEERRSGMLPDRGAAARESAVATSAPPPRRMAGKAAMEQPTAIDLTIQVTDAEAAVREIEARIGQVHARITEKRLGRGSELLKVETAAPNVAALLDLLRTIGRVNIETRPFDAPKGHVTVTIKFAGRPP
ncbi:MAG: DUF2275 domain-containing protein [Thermodesulfobacteriota bacterium]